MDDDNPLPPPIRFILAFFIVFSIPIGGYFLLHSWPIIVPPVLAIVGVVYVIRLAVKGT